MDDYSKNKIEQSIYARETLHATFIKKVKTYPVFAELEKKAFSNGALDTRVKELMALAISIVTKCEPCIEWHVAQALQTGATEEEIYETIDVAIEMGGGPAAAYARFVLKAVDYFTEKNTHRVV
jgi:AhpD family alkylhydroperoxidase